MQMRSHRPTLELHSHTSVDRNSLSRDKRGSIAGEENDHTGDLLRPSSVTQHGPRFQPLRPFRIGGKVGVGLSGEGPWRHRVNRDVLRAEVGGQRSGQSVEPGLGRRVCDIAGSSELPHDD
jgi:hypothetical protein